MRDDALQTVRDAVYSGRATRRLRQIFYSLNTNGAVGRTASSWTACRSCFSSPPPTRPNTGPAYPPWPYRCIFTRRSRHPHPVSGRIAHSKAK